MLEALNRFAHLASSRSEVIGAAFVILILVMMVIPLSPAMLDTLLALNICLSIVMVISAMLIETPLAFSSFPAILLISTLFRLALTISTTRQILLEADAGHIVQTFGEFVVGGNVVVGLVIFLIISIVNFLVVTKGSERVAEVAARFSLDGMPGKQMSIDSDLRAGLITQTIAKQRRRDLEKESQLFGAMDGAIKFVKNDAIAGLVITVVNLLGGLAIGMIQKDMTFAEAGHIYTILSVGDGLVAILPSLMVSVAAGLIVTRVTKGEADGANTAQDMIRELSQNSKALQISAIVCLMFAFVPGMPSMVFAIGSASLLLLWFKSTPKTRALSAEPHEQAMDFNQLIAQGKKPLPDLLQTQTFSALEVRLPTGLDQNLSMTLQNICRMARNNQVNHLGVMLPVFEFTEHKEEFAEFFVYGVPSLAIHLTDRRICIRCSAEAFASISNEIEVTRIKDNQTGRYLVLCEDTYQTVLNQKNIPFVLFEERILEQIETLLVRKIEQLFTLNEYQRHITLLGEQYAEQLKELERVLPTTKALEVTQRLLGERVSIKNMRSVLNSLIEWGQRERDPQIIAEQVRRGLAEQICYQHTDANRTLKVFVCSMELEQLIRESIRSDGNNAYLDIDSSTAHQMAEMIDQQMQEHLGDKTLPVIVCSIDCRYFLKGILNSIMHSVAVISHQEISSSVQIRVLGNLNVEAAHGSNN